MTFLSPLGALAVLLALVPAAALAHAVLRAERAARSLGLTPPSRRVHAPALVLAVLACACAGVAAAQPALERNDRRSVRSRSEVLYIVDVSRSMAAARSRTAPTRLEQARGVVRTLHTAVADVPSGLSGLTDRVLPYLFATADVGTFDATLRRSVTIESPPPQQVSRNATSFDALSRLSGGGFFGDRARTRTCVLVTDGEARSLPRSLPCRLIVVRVGSSSDRVYDADGVPEPAYVPDRAAASKVQALAAATGGRAFSGAGPAATALRAAADVGPSTGVATRVTRHGLAPWLALAALVLTIGVAPLRVDTESLRHATVPD